MPAGKVDPIQASATPSVGLNLMTHSSEYWKFGFAGILLALATGCGSGAAGTELTGEPDAKLNEAGFISVADSLDDPGYCGYRDLGVDQSGNPQVEEERYYYPVMNRLLAEDPQLGLYTGLATGSTCDEARQFVAANNGYQASAPRASLSKSDLLANFPIMPAEPPKRDPNAPVQKIIGGDDSDGLEEVVQFGYANKGKTANCSATRLAGALFLTAAHCLSIADHPAKEPYIIDLPYSWVKHVVDNLADGEFYTSQASRCKNLPPKSQCASLALEAYMNPNYVGSNDQANDLAVVHVLNDSQQFFRSVPSADRDFRIDVVFLSTTTPKIGDSIEAVGWGPDGNADAKLRPDQFNQRRAAPVPIANMDGVAPSMQKDIYIGNWVYTNAAAHAQLCKGDSGGGFYNDFSNLVGVTSFAATFDAINKSCAKVGTAQYAARVDYQAFSFIPKAMLKLQKAADSTLCTCAFFPSLNDPTGKDPEAAGAHIKCNVGCEDPAQWTN